MLVSNKYVTKIGFMDSGIGGLNLLSKAVETFPIYNYVYYGDNKNAPYGNKSAWELKKLATIGIEKLLNENAKIIVVACNTLSTTILDYLKAISPVPIIPTLPVTTNLDYKNKVLLATPKTTSSSYVINNFSNYTIVPMPFLASEIERFINEPNKISLEKDLLSVPEGVDYIYLGCTHYIFLKDKISKILNAKVEDNAISVCNLLDKELKKTPLNNGFSKPTITFIGENCEYNLNVFRGLLFPKKTHKIISVPKNT